MCIHEQLRNQIHTMKVGSHKSTPKITSTPSSSEYSLLNGTSDIRVVRLFTRLHLNINLVQQHDTVFQ